MDQRDYIGRRLRPLRSMPEFFTLRHLLAKISEMVSVLERSGWEFPLRVLDAGAGCAPYRTLFPSEYFRYVAVDREIAAGTSAIADGLHLPFKDGDFDLVLSNQVLEHVSDPRRVAAELTRVVSNRGYVLLSCPFVWEIHDFPVDYWRFSEEALRLLFADMDLVYLEPSTNSAQCLAQTLNLLINRNFDNRLLKAFVFRVTNSRPLLNMMPKHDALLPANYVVAVKKQLSTDGMVEARLPAALEPAQFRVHVDAPGPEKLVHKPCLRVTGWIAANTAIGEVRARIDDSVEAPLAYNRPRVDVWRAFPHFTNAHRSGFEGELQIDRLASGAHLLRIIGVAAGRTLSGEPVTFRIDS